MNRAPFDHSPPPKQRRRVDWFGIVFYVMAALAAVGLGALILWLVP